MAQGQQFWELVYKKMSLNWKIPAEPWNWTRPTNHLKGASNTFREVMPNLAAERNLTDINFTANN